MTMNKRWILLVLVLFLCYWQVKLQLTPVIRYVYGKSDMAYVAEGKQYSVVNSTEQSIETNLFAIFDGPNKIIYINIDIAVYWIYPDRTVVQYPPSTDCYVNAGYGFDQTNYGYSGALFNGYIHGVPQRHLYNKNDDHNSILKQVYNAFSSVFSGYRDEWNYFTEDAETESYMGPVNSFSSCCTRGGANIYQDKVSRVQRYNVFEQDNPAGVFINGTLSTDTVITVVLDYKRWRKLKHTDIIPYPTCSGYTENLCQEEYIEKGYCQSQQNVQVPYIIYFQEEPKKILK